MSRFGKKTIVAVTMIAAAGCLMLSIILNDTLTRVDANVAFNGISNIISSYSDKTPYNIVEIVPSFDDASIGYLIDGEEYENWNKNLSTIVRNDGTGKTARTTYMNTLKEKFGDIITEEADNSKPLYYQEYSESYVDDGESTLVELAGVDIIPKDTTGYGIELAEGGSYKFSTEYVTAVNAEGFPAGEYNQNVHHYVYIAEDIEDEAAERGYYGIVFKEADIPAGTSNYDYFNPIDEITGEVKERAAYMVKSAYAIAQPGVMDNIKQNDPNALIYRVTNSDIDSAYEFVDIASNITTELLDFDSYMYFKVEMQYVPAENIKENATYYIVDEEAFVYFFEDKSGEYGAVLDEEEPYIKVYDPDAETINNGFFNVKEGSEMYMFVGVGKGDCNVVESEDMSLDYPLQVSRIYVKGGLKNNDWFRNGVFNQDNTDKCKDMSFNVGTYTPIALGNINWSQVNMIYINAGDNTFGADLDIEWNVALSILKRVSETGFMMPAVVDNGVIEGMTGADFYGDTVTNMQRLVALLCCSNYDELAANDGLEDPLAINWNNIKFDKVAGNDYPYGYVNKNVYVIPKKQAGETNFLLKEDFAAALTQQTDNDDVFFADADALGFGEIAEYINSENTIRRTENDANTGTQYEYFDRKIGKDIILSYIISYASKRINVDESEVLNILDIEPGLVTANSEGAMTYQMLKSWLGEANCPSEENVNITYITSSEFIGKIEDLNNYDMIYMGLVCDANYKDNDGNTIYNDPEMNGLIYVNVGDVTVINSGNYFNGHSGLLENDYLHDGNNNRTMLNPTLTLMSSPDYSTAINTYRYSGNDFTIEKRKEMQNYVKAGFPVVLAEGIIDGNEVNSRYIDNSSNVYELIDSIKDSANVFTMKNGTVDDSFFNMLSTEKPEIILKEMPKVEGFDYVELKDNKITLEFSINNKGGVDVNALFDIALLLDINADGKFSATQEKLAPNDYSVYQNGTLLKPTLVDGQYHYAIPAGNMVYRLEYELPKTYVGVIPWKMNISQATNEYRYDAVSGYFYRKSLNGEREIVKVLQINTDGYSTLDMYENVQFNNLIKDLEDFDLRITRVSARVFARDYVDGYLDNFDMIVIGFADCYGITNENNCLIGIKNYINMGKPVLFTHDTTSFANDSVGTNIWGYDFNKIIRSDVGMDRYAIIYNDALKTGETLSATDETIIGATGKSASTLYNEALQYQQEHTSDIAYKPNSNKSVIVRQNQGFTYWSLDRYKHYGQNNIYGKYNCLTGIEDGKSVRFTTQKARVVNRGQITTYPYMIPDNLEIANTHYQYYQLEMNKDMDKDEMGDIVVWYVLDGEAYNRTPGDVRNSYYIYTMGNITYSGVGHSAVNGEDEMKLYINTLIAAYNSGVHAPNISIKETAEEESPDLSTLYVSIDDAIAGENYENAMVDGAEAAKDIYFTIKDTNIVRMHKSTVVHADFAIPIDEQEYQKGKNGEDGRNPDEYLFVDNDSAKIYLKKIKVNIRAADDDSAYNDVQMSVYASGIKYRAEIPLSLLPEGKNSQDIYLVGYSTISKYANDGVSTGEILDTSYSYASFKLQRIGLADLD